jgi:hypothetical protein
MKEGNPLITVRAVNLGLLGGRDGKSCRDKRDTRYVNNLTNLCEREPTLSLIGQLHKDPL